MINYIYDILQLINLGGAVHMTTFNLLQEASQYIEDHKNNEIFTSIDRSIHVNRTLPQQKKIHLHEIATIQNTSFTARDGAEIKARIYIPESTKTTLPLIMYYHGGGWVIGDLDYMDGGCQYLTKHSEAIVISIDYRLAPEHPYPIPQNDAYDALLWVFKNDLKLPIDFTKTAVAGDSAGGNLAASVVVRALEENGPKIHKQLLIYPALDAENQYPSYEKFGTDLGLGADEMQQYYNVYIPQKELKSHPYVSPKQYEQKHLLPETIIVAAQYDVLNDEGLDYVKELQQAAVKCEHHVLPGLIHSFFSKMDYFEQQTDDATALLGRFFKQ